MLRIPDSEKDVRTEIMDTASPTWLHSHGWQPSLETVIIVHGYGGTSDSLPAGVLRDGNVSYISKNFRLEFILCFDNLVY